MNEQTQKLRDQIQKKYNCFYEKLEINPETGIWTKAPQGRELRFATMPHIGENYHNATKKILFVGYDIGKDEARHIRTFDERYFCDTDFYDFNPHIAGTYIQAMFLLKDSEEFNLKDNWDSIKDLRIPNKTALKTMSRVCPNNLLSYIAQTNLYKFVTVDRGKEENGEKQGRKGDSDRKWFHQKDNIENLLIEEIKILKPDIIFFQGLGTINESIWGEIRSICDWNMEKYHSYHPSDFNIDKNFNVPHNSPAYIALLKGVKV